VESIWSYGRPIGVRRNAKDKYGNSMERRIYWGVCMIIIGMIVIYLIREGII